MKNIEKLKNVINSNKYMLGELDTYYNKLLYNKNLTRINFDCPSYVNIRINPIFCNILIYKNKAYRKTLKIRIKINIEC